MTTITNQLDIYILKQSTGGVVAGAAAGGKEGRSFHELTGAVKKRNQAFKQAMRIKLGWKKGEGDSSSALRESLA
jgi:hypothetical protein